MHAFNFEEVVLGFRNLLFVLLRLVGIGLYMTNSLSRKESICDTVNLIVLVWLTVESQIDS